MLPGTEPATIIVDKNKWKVVYKDSEHIGEGEAVQIIDDNPDTFWHTKWTKDNKNEPKHPHEIQIDMGEELKLSAVTCLPRQDGSNGRIAKYELYLSKDGKDWGKPASIGTFKNSTELQTVKLKEETIARYIKLIALSEVAGNAWASCAEISVQTSP